MKEYFEEAKKLQSELVEIRRELHMTPEIGMDLPITTQIVKNRLESLGLEPKLYGKSGISVTIGKKEGKCFLIRGDMDALPIKEEADISHRSKNENMHACGHDFHTTMLLGAAKLLKDNENSINGKVKLMFQPGEELLAGAKEMIKEGILENPKVDAAAMIHVYPGIDAKSGTFVLPEKGFFSTASDWYEVNIQGKGGHAAMPDLTIDPLMVMSHIHLTLQNITSQEISKEDFGIISTTIMKGGVVDNAIPDTAYMRGSIRTLTEDTRKLIFKRIPEVANGIAQSFGATVNPVMIEGCPASVVDEDLCTFVRTALKDEMGEDSVIYPEEVGMKRLGGSEDFSYITQEVPSTMLLLAAGRPEDGFKYGVHHPKVEFDEEILHRGSAALCIMATKWLEENN